MTEGKREGAGKAGSNRSAAFLYQEFEKRRSVVPRSVSTYLLEQYRVEAAVYISPARIPELSTLYSSWWVESECLLGAKERERGAGADSTH